ncbi:TPA: LysR family transcriptional regulator [Pseudomonas putida]|nr:LysR family transcriptional regulator [Pseudomonas putida]
MHNLLHWKLLLLAVELKSISKAAVVMGVSQSASSQAIAHIEHGLGMQILCRKREGVIPTLAGITVIDDARIMIDAFELLKSKVVAEDDYFSRTEKGPRSTHLHHADARRSTPARK